MHRRGFTLLELVIVVSILAILAGTVVSMLETTADGATVDATRAELATLRDACMRWKSDLGFYPVAATTAPDADAQASPLYDLTVSDPTLLSPSDQAQLVARGYASSKNGQLTVVPWNPTSRRGWRGPYVTSLRTTVVGTTGNLLDPWMRAYRYQPDGTFVLTSAGPDGVFNTATSPSTDDVSLVLPP
jgi:prepilin-type N-terminal cleavage/methylation domain-containing protein